MTNTNTDREILNLLDATWRTLLMEATCKVVLCRRDYEVGRAAWQRIAVAEAQQELLALDSMVPTSEEDVWGMAREAAYVVACEA